MRELAGDHADLCWKIRLKCDLVFYHTLVVDDMKLSKDALFCRVLTRHGASFRFGVLTSISANRRRCYEFYGNSPSFAAQRGGIDGLKFVFPRLVLLAQLLPSCARSLQFAIGRFSS
jgi:hypothetical protein